MSRFSSRTSRFATAGALTLAGISLMSPAAFAAGTSLVDRDVLPNVASGRLSLVVDAPNSGAQNNVRITRAGDRYVVTDNRDGVRAQVASRCDEFLTGQPVTDARVECPVRDIYGLGVFLRDGDDTVHNATDLPSFIMVHSGNDEALGGSASDRIRGDTGNDALSGEAGDDSLSGDEDDDVLDGGAGKDDLDGGEGTDTLLGGPGADTLHNSPGQDDFRGGQDGTGSRAAEPVDTVSYFAGVVSEDPPIRVTLDNNSNDGRAGEFDNVRDDVEKVVGANGPDHFVGNDFANVFLGDDAGDLLVGAGGADILRGEFGTDELHGGEGPDTLSGGGDSDVILGEGGNDVIDGDEFGRGYPDIISGGTGGDTVTYAGRSNPVSVDFDGVADDGEAAEQDKVEADVEHAIGGKGDDTLTGSAKNNRLEGGDGDDRIEGGAAADVLDGGAGNDTILARDGVADTVTCGAGNDTVDADPIDVIAADCAPEVAPEAPPVLEPEVEPFDAGELPEVEFGEAGEPAATCPAVRVRSTRVSVSKPGVARIRVAAARDADAVPCRVRVTLRAGSRLGTGSARVAPGRTATVRVALTKRARQRLAGRRAALRTRVELRTVDGAGDAVTRRATVKLAGARG